MSKLFEALTSTQLEREIVKGMNNEQIFDEYVQEIVEYLRSIGVEGNAKHIGFKRYSVSPEWSEYNPKKSLPKTDIIIGDKRISIKSKDSFQIMDANKNELLALFYCSSNNTDIIKSRMSKNIIDTFQKLIYNQTASGTVGKTKKIDPVLQEAEVMHKELQKQLEIMFTNNVLFKKNFIKEVLTGLYKFGPQSEASSTHILILSPNEIVFSPIDDKIINMFANKINIHITFSSRGVRGLGASGKYRYWSVVRMIVEHLFENKLMYANGQLNEKSIVYIRNIINYILSLFTSIENILQFLEIEPEISIMG